MTCQEYPGLEKLKDKRWRLENLYTIIDKSGREIEKHGSFKAWTFVGR